MMGRLAFMLALGVVACALSAVTSRYESRWVVVELNRANHEAGELDVEWRRLQIDLTDYAQHARIDSIARQDLKMSVAAPDRTLYMRPGGAPANLVTTPAARAAAAAAAAARRQQ